MSTVGLVIAGTYVVSDAYPNVKFRIRNLKADHRFRVIEVSHSVPLSLDYSSRPRLVLSAVQIGIRAAMACIGVLAGIVRHRRAELLYIPYPSLHIALALSFLPQRWVQDKVVIDAFISVFDTAVIDRQLIDAKGFLARLLFLAERRAFLRGSVVITDTPENADYYAKLFRIPRTRLIDVPLSIDSDTFQPVSNARVACSGEPLRVLFIGTLVPLHGIEIIVDALERLPQEVRMELTLVGDGQQSALLARGLHQQSLKNEGVKVEWIRGWQESSDLAKLIATADVCLGIFGSEGKAQRVWPLKNYLYLACGCPFITVDSSVSRRLMQGATGSPFFSVDASDGAGLAARLDCLATNRDRLCEIREQTRTYYDSMFSGRVVQRRLRQAMLGG